jgi:ankyrin repeat protein
VDLPRFLIEHGADATVQDEDGSTPLHQAAYSYNGNADLARFLIEHGADVTTADKQRIIPQNRALLHRREEFRQIMKNAADARARAIRQTQQRTT